MGCKKDPLGRLCLLAGLENPCYPHGRALLEEREA